MVILAPLLPMYRIGSAGESVYASTGARSSAGRVLAADEIVLSWCSI